MTKKITVILLPILILITALLFTNCSVEKEEPPQAAASAYTDFINAGKRIAVQTGDIYGVVAADVFKTQAQEYNSPADMLEALHTGRIDAALIDGSYIKPLTESGGYPDIDFLWIPEDVFVNESAHVFQTAELCDKYNEWLEKIRADGTLDEIVGRWIGVPLPENGDIPEFETTGENGTLVVCDTGNYPPFTYFGENGKPAGFDYEITSRFAQYLGMKLETVMMSYDAVMPYVLSGKADMSACLYTKTVERSENVFFGNPCVVSRGVLAVPSGSAALDYTDFEGKDIAVITGVLTYTTTEKIGGKPVLYNDSSAAAEDVRLGRVAGYMHALSAVRVMAAELGNDMYEAIAVPGEIFAAQIGGISQSQAIIDSFNEFLGIITADGTLEDMKSRWFSESLDMNAPVPVIQNTGLNGVLKVAVCSDSVPYVFIGKNGEFSGFSAELALRFGAYEGKTVEFTDMAFGGLIPYTASQKADIGLANMAVTEERKKSVLFTEPFFDEQHGILALKQTGENLNSGTILDYTDFTGKSIGMITGSVWDTMIEKNLGAVPAYYTDLSAVVEDIRKGRTDGLIYDLSAVRVLAASPGNEDLEVIEIPAKIFNAPMSALSLDKNIIDRFNTFLAEIKVDGTFDDMQSRWLKTVPNLDSPMPDIPLGGENGTLRIATYSGALPFVYAGSNGELKGYSVELALRFAAREGMKAEFTDMDFGGMIPSVISGKADIAIANISVTEERKKSVLFTESIYDDQAGIIVLKGNNGIANAAGGFTEWLKNGIERNLITDSRWKMIVDGLGVTMTIALFSQLFGTVFGCLVCFALTRKNRFVRRIAGLYCGLIHGTPVVVLLMITYYIIFGSSGISNVIVAVAAFTMITGASIGGNLKSAVETVDAAEIEAARSIGFTPFKAFFTVTFPQAVCRALPGYTNGFVELVKATAIVGYIAIQDLTRAGDIIRSRTYDAYFPLLFISAVYLAVTTTCVQLFKLVIKKMNGGEKT